MANTVKTRILIISDTHCAQLSSKDNARAFPAPPFSSPLPSADLLIHCGDLTYTGKIEEYHRALDMLKEIDAPVKLAIAGNHDLTLDQDFILRHLDKPGAQGGWKPTGNREQGEAIIREARAVWVDPAARARKDGIQLLEEGVHDINLPNGARVRVYASPYTPAFCDWAFAYDHDEDRFNTSAVTAENTVNTASNPIPSFNGVEDSIDICITHGPPHKILDVTQRGHISVGCPHLRRAIKRARPMIHCFGHIHEGWGGERVTWDKEIDGDVKPSSALTESWEEREGEFGAAQDASRNEAVEVNFDEAKRRHGVFVDLSDAGGRGLRKGAETLFVNASIMSVEYQPQNAPWVLDVDLPTGTYMQ